MWMSVYYGFIDRNGLWKKKLTMNAQMAGEAGVIIMYAKIRYK